MLTITHTHQQGTLIDGTSRGDGTAAILRAQRWRWSRNLGSWYLPHSRDKVAKVYEIERTRNALNSAGFPTDVEIDNQPRDAAAVEADRIERAQERADALAAKAARKDRAAERAVNNRDATLNALPEGGEPIKIGHHSESRHRKAVDRAHVAMARSIEAEAEAADAQHAASIAAGANTRRNHPRTVANRIERISADIRKLERRGADKEGHPQHYLWADWTSQAEYWTEVRAAQIANGKAWDAACVAVGDKVRDRWDWYTVKRVNPKSVSTDRGPIAYADMTGHITKQQFEDAQHARS